MDKGCLWSPFIKALVPFLRALPSRLNHFPKALPPLPNTIPSGLNILTYEFGVHIQIIVEVTLESHLASLNLLIPRTEATVRMKQDKYCSYFMQCVLTHSGHW